MHTHIHKCAHTQEHAERASREASASWQRHYEGPDISAATTVGAKNIQSESLLSAMCDLSMSRNTSACGRVKMMTSGDGDAQVCMYVCMYINMYLYMYVCIYIYMYMCLYS